MSKKITAQYYVVCDKHRDCCTAHSDCAAEFRYYPSQNKRTFNTCDCN